MYIVYKHSFPNNKVYIGITSKSVSFRWRKNGEGYNKQFVYRAIKKYGWDNVKHEILFTNLSKKEAENKEIELIKQYKSNNPRFGYNIENGGNSKGKTSDFTKQKISNANKGKFAGKNNPMFGKKPMLGKHLSEEAKHKISVAHKGKKLSGSTKEKLRKSHLGMKLSDDAREKIRLSNLNRKHSSETKRKMSQNSKGIKNPMYGKKHREESKLKMSISRSGKNHWNFGGHKSEETKQKLREAHIGIKVECLETGKVYNYINEASKDTNINKKCISNCIHGKQKTAGGFHWVIFNDLEQ